MLRKVIEYSGMASVVVCILMLAPSEKVTSAEPLDATNACLAFNVNANALPGTFPPNANGSVNYNEVAKLSFDCSTANQPLCGVCFISLIQSGPTKNGPFNGIWGGTTGSTGQVAYASCGSANNKWTLTLNFGPLTPGTWYKVMRSVVAMPAGGCGGVQFPPPYITEVIAQPQ